MTATPRVAGITGADDQGQAGCTASQEASERPRGEADSRNAEFDGAEPAAPVDVASPCGAAESNDSEKQRDLLRKECKTLQIVIHALRVKDEECQVRAHEFAASRTPTTIHRPQRVRRESPTIVGNSLHKSPGIFSFAFLSRMADSCKSNGVSNGQGALENALTWWQALA